MSNIKQWSNSAGGNSTISNGGWAENMAANLVNDQARGNLSAMRTWYESAEWTDWGHTPTRVSDTTFNVPGNQTSVYTRERRIKASNGSSTLYGTITTSTYSAAGSTGVYVSLDSGAMTSSLSAVAVGIKDNIWMPTQETAPHATRAAYLEMGTRLSGSATSTIAFGITIGSVIPGGHYLIEAYVSSASATTVSGSRPTIYISESDDGGNSLKFMPLIGTNPITQTMLKETAYLKSIMYNDYSSTITNVVVSFGSTFLGPASTYRGSVIRIK